MHRLFTHVLLIQLVLLPALHGLAPCANHTHCTDCAEEAEHQGMSEQQALHHHTGHHDSDHSDECDRCTHGCSCHLGLTSAAAPTEPQPLLTACCGDSVPQLPNGYLFPTRPPPRA